MLGQQFQGKPLCVMDTTVTETARFSSDVSNNETPTPRGETSESWLGNITKELWLLQYRKCSADRPPSSSLWLHRLIPSFLLTPLQAHWPPRCSLLPRPLPAFPLPRMPFPDTSACSRSRPFPDTSVAYSRALFSPLFKQHLLSKVFSA